MDDWVEERNIEKEERRERLSQLVNFDNMNVTLALRKMNNNGILKGLIRDVCDSCGFGLTRSVKGKKMVKCPECGSRDITSIVGDKPLKKSKTRQTILNKQKGGINMATEKELLREINKLRATVRELKEDQDKTTGKVGSDEDKEDLASDAVVLEIAESGKGFAIWRDYKQDQTGKLKRLVRD